YPAAVAGNSCTPSSPPTESSAAATCMSACVSTPPVMTRVSSTMVVIAVPFMAEGWHAPAGRRTCDPRPLPRPGRSDRQRRWVPLKPGPGRQIVSKDSPSGVSRFEGQAGTQAPDATPPPSQDRGSRARSTTHILPADYALAVDEEFAAPERHRTSCYGARRALGSQACASCRYAFPQGV